VSNAPDDSRQQAAGPVTPSEAMRRPGRGSRLRAAVRHTAIGSAQVLLIAAGVALLGYVLSRLWSVLLPVILGLLVTRVLWPATRFLRAHRWPPAVAASATVIGFLALLTGVVLLIVPPVVGQSGELADQAGAGLEKLQSWFTGPPLNLGEEQIGQAIDNVTNSLQDNAQQIAGSALGWVSSLGSGIINAVLALVLTFFFLKDGPRWLPWLAEQTGRRVGRHIARLSEQSWQTLSDFIRQQAVVGFIDAFFIGIGLWITGVPLVLPLAVLTFVGAFVPIIGAFVAGGFAVLIALVSEGLTTALIVLGIVVLVQQLEGNVLQPIIQGRGLNLHPAVVILAVTAGSSLAGIVGAFLAVPVAAVIAVIYRYARDQINDRPPATAGDRPQTGDDTGERAEA
jgi:predicted PurR-regulated permease PerM